MLISFINQMKRKGDVLNMITEGTLVKFVKCMYPDKLWLSWLEGRAGVVIKSFETNNIVYGDKYRTFRVKLIVPVETSNGGTIEWITGVSEDNLEEITRKPIILRETK